MPECQIEWGVLDLPTWESYFARVRRSNLLQSYPYAQAACAFYRQRARWGVIRIDDQVAGLVQILEAGLFSNVLHGIVLDRGPLWLPGFDIPENIVAFFAVFDHEFPKRWGRRRRIIPEISESQAMLVPFIAAKGIRPYQTIWFDTTKDEDVLRAGLEKKWRNALSKAERENVRCVWAKIVGPELDWLLLHHDFHRRDKNFRAASPKFIRMLARYFAPRGDMLIGQAFHDQALQSDEPIASILFFRHGTAATYQIGWNGEAGRAVNAHHLLLWQAALTLKAEGIMDIDLGGIHDDAAGVRAFKEGMGGESVTLSGLYR